MPATFEKEQKNLILLTVTDQDNVTFFIFVIAVVVLGIILFFLNTYLNHFLVKATGIAQSAQRLATGWTVRGSNPGGDEIFRSRPDRLRGPPSLLYNEYRVSGGGKSAGAWRRPPILFQRRGCVWVELYLCPPPPHLCLHSMLQSDLYIYLSL